MLIAMFLSFVLVLATMLIHFEVLRRTSAFLPRCGVAGQGRGLGCVYGPHH